MAHQADQAFSNFHVKLDDFLNVLLPSLSILFLKANIFISKELTRYVYLSLFFAVLTYYTQITEHCFIRINYESMVDWCQHTDYLCSNPCFFGSPHFDCVFIRLTENKVILAGWSSVLNDLNLVRVHARPQAQAQFFPVRSFIGGALLVLDGPSDYFGVDTADTDMFLCIKMMNLEAGHIVHI
ncbi:hypothetical protein DFJ58DRAFT_661535 [Suillus subalutaceus]|uniref:uncharacterized protein n=1 Tax=Suillus subalutaceus TaxID=48586 RepID=UPI001B87AF85|nr:uncharacterized protein DFJ58DRAFT_661535 [Suillus subalutaceus]KAG1851626.1 hypothetical protein DFJ58DRAFT_661535 [Suillus subalutaceus]